MSRRYVGVTPRDFRAGWAVGTEFALIAREALAATELAINRRTDAAAFRNTMQVGFELVACSMLPSIS
jgi:hypothetical protein